jgi:uncharacterized surface protein with fasciclin (FAS1) repeats
MKYLKKIILFLFIAWLASCNDPYENTLFQVFDMNPVSTYLESRSDEFSEWTIILKHADLFNAINQASEMFTVFVPDNEAVQEFYRKKGVSSIEELGKPYARELARYHIIGDTVNLETFVKGGKLEEKTLSDDYLSVTFDEESATGGGFNSLYVNNEARIKEAAIKVSNGYVYVMDAVLSPLVETVYERLTDIESSPGNKKYSLFKEVVDLTGWADSLSTIYVDIVQPNGIIRQQKNDFTLFAVSDETYSSAGIESISDLALKLGAENNQYTDKNNELFKYAAYHIIPGNYSLFELRSFDGNATKRLWGTAAEAVMEISLQEGEKYYINFEGKIGDEEVSAMFIENGSDVQAKNGILHEVDDYLPLWESVIPIRVEWDFADYPEVASYISTNGTTGQVFQQSHPSAEYRTEITELSVYTVDWKPSATPTSSFNYVDYFTAKASNDWSKCKNYDMLALNLGYTGSISMKSPIVISGKYKVSLKFGFANSMDFMRTQSSGSNGGMVQFTFDNKPETTVQVPIYASVPEKKLGVYDTVIHEEIEFTKTGNHTLKMVIMDPSAATNSSFRVMMDYLLFEPIIEE